MKFKLWLENREELAFKRALDHDPADWEIRSIYADWLEENGLYSFSKMQRWLEDNHKCPDYDHRNNLWCWYNEDKYHPDITFNQPLSVQNAIIDDKIFKKLSNLTQDPYHTQYKTREEAEQDLAHALQGLTNGTELKYKKVAI